MVPTSWAQKSHGADGDGVAHRLRGAPPTSGQRGGGGFHGSARCVGSRDLSVLCLCYKMLSRPQAASRNGEWEAGGGDGAGEGPKVKGRGVAAGMVASRACATKLQEKHSVQTAM